MITVCLKAGLEHTAWTVFSHLAIWGTMVLWFLFLIAYSHVYPTLPLGPEMVGMVRALVAAAYYRSAPRLCQIPVYTFMFILSMLYHGMFMHV